ncbi:MAG TPA: VWA domain-containing protein [Cytophagales bacterium]|nr:VWA domain-containing protein [Cytophagales bacterium]
MYKRFFILIVFFSSICLSQFTFGQGINKQELPKKVRILFLLDGSGSMLAKWENLTRMDIAKRLLVDIVDSLKVNPDLELGLRVYGHMYDKRYNNCTDSKLEVPFVKGNHENIKYKIRNLKPQGVTPIAYSLEQAANDFPKEKNVRNIIIIITDGLESCKGDPCAVSLALQKKNIFLKPFIIGIGGEQGFAEAFQCMGKYYDADNVDKFRKALKTAIRQTLYKTTVTVSLLNIKDQPKETNVNMTFVNNVTGEAKYDFVHLLDKNGNPDTLEVDPVLSYDLVINTIPKVVKKNIQLEGGMHNDISVKTPQGSLSFSPVLFDVTPQILVRQNGRTEILNIQKLNLSENYLVGKYDLEVLTLPRLIIENVAIHQSKNTVIDIPSPGKLIILDNFTGFGSLYKIKEDGSQEWIYNFENNNSRMTLTLMPGDYKMVFRAEKAFTSKFTDVQNFTIKSGSNNHIKLFSK